MSVKPKNQKHSRTSKTANYGEKVKWLLENTHEMYRKKGIKQKLSAIVNWFLEKKQE